MMLSPDTTFDIEKAQFEIYRRMGPQRRSTIGFELSDNMRDIAFDSYRSANPSLSGQELQLRFLERVLGWRLPQHLERNILERES